MCWTPISDCHLGQHLSGAWPCPDLMILFVIMVSLQAQLQLDRQGDLPAHEEDWLLVELNALDLADELVSAATCVLTLDP
jgi:hypothetical protein